MTRILFGQEEGSVGGPGGAPFYMERGDDWAHFDNTVNAVSFGFVATAILIFMFLVMAIFEKFFRPDSLSDRSSGNVDLVHHPKLAYHPSEVSMNAKEVPVVMPGDDVPTFIANPAPIVCKVVSMNAKEVPVVMPGDDVPTFIANPAPIPCPPNRIRV